MFKKYIFLFAITFTSTSLVYSNGFTDWWNRPAYYKTPVYQAQKAAIELQQFKDEVRNRELLAKKYNEVVDKIYNLEATNIQQKKFNPTLFNKIASETKTFFQTWPLLTEMEKIDKKISKPFRIGKSAFKLKQKEINEILQAKASFYRLDNSVTKEAMHYFQQADRLERYKRYPYRKAPFYQQQMEQYGNW